MTVTDFGYFDETVGLLREKGHDVRHFTLLAERETVLKRLRERGFGHLPPVRRRQGRPFAQGELGGPAARPLPGAAART